MHGTLLIHGTLLEVLCTSNTPDLVQMIGDAEPGKIVDFFKPHDTTGLLHPPCGGLSDHATNPFCFKHGSCRRIGSPTRRVAHL